LQCFEHYQSRPEFGLNDLQQDPYEIENLVGKPDYGAMQVRLKEQLVAWMKQRGDLGNWTEFDALSRKGVHDTKPPSSNP